MDVSLESIRRELAEAELDDGLVVFASLMSVTAVGLALLVQVLTSPTMPRTALLLVPALIVAGQLTRRWRRAQLHRNLEARFGLSYPILEQCAELAGLDPELKALVGDALAVSITINRLSHHRAFDALGITLDEELDAVRGGLLEVLRRARAARQVREVLAACEATVRRPDRLVPLRRRAEAQRRELAEVVEALEAMLVELADALAAALEQRGDRSELTERLAEFSAGMSRLARSLDFGDELLLGERES